MRSLLQLREIRPCPATAHFRLCEELGFPGMRPAFDMCRIEQHARIEWGLLYRYRRTAQSTYHFERIDAMIQNIGAERVWDDGGKRTNPKRTSATSICSYLVPKIITSLIVAGIPERSSPPPSSQLGCCDDCPEPNVGWGWGLPLNVEMAPTRTLHRPRILSESAAEPTIQTAAPQDQEYSPSSMAAPHIGDHTAMFDGRTNYPQRVRRALLILWNGYGGYATRLVAADHICLGSRLLTAVFTLYGYPFALSPSEGIQAEGECGNLCHTGLRGLALSPSSQDSIACHRNP
ncbi:hypothetical protein NMY22_g7613 [Coprinellus aureogranulatus]|nr:hypothetical protein NMY22_g7613 [Coprinellus aureogranulatus]